MNQSILKAYIEAYKKNFKKIREDELYKWQAIRAFQDKWDPNAVDFSEMLHRSLKPANNLLASQKYYARRMIVRNAEHSPDVVRDLFINLFNEEQPLIPRIVAFQHGVAELTSTNYPGDKHDQDLRAVMVYLCLQYPDTYYLYKYSTYRGFAEKVDFPMRPKKGDNHSIISYNALSNIVKEQLERDEELKSFHRSSIPEDAYFDQSLNVLTQDFIFAVVYVLGSIETIGGEPSAVVIENAEGSEVNGWTPGVGRGIDTDQIVRAQLQKRLGLRGEMLVMEYERGRLKELGLSESLLQHVSLKDDGAGFDILSVDENRKPTYIEVKTTSGELDTTFYITRRELEKSKKVGEQYRLYRVYNCKDGKGTVRVFNGSLVRFCQEPYTYAVKLKI